MIGKCIPIIDNIRLLIPNDVDSNNFYYSRNQNALFNKNKGEYM